MAWTERAQARPITSFTVTISLSRSAAAMPRFRRSETSSSSGVSTTMACRSPNRSASRPEVATSIVPAWPISIRTRPCSRAASSSRATLNRLSRNSSAISILVRPST